MELTILSPTYKKTLSIVWLEVETTTGNIVIQPGHAPMIAMLETKKSATFCLKNGKQESIPVSGGIVEINRHTATLILNE